MLLHIFIQSLNICSLIQVSSLRTEWQEGARQKMYNEGKIMRALCPHEACRQLKKRGVCVCGGGH